MYLALGRSPERFLNFFEMQDTLLYSACLILDVLGLESSVDDGIIQLVSCGKLSSVVNLSLVANVQLWLTCHLWQTFNCG